MFDSAWAFISAWYNLPFTFLLGLCVILAALQLIGLGGEGDHGAGGAIAGSTQTHPVML